MNKKLMFVILLLGILTFGTTISSYASNSNPSLDGVVTEAGCKAVKGIMVPDTLNEQSTESGRLCLIDNSMYYAIYKWGGFCTENIASWTDPKTGIVYNNIPTPCDVPIAGNISGNAVISGSGYYNGTIQIGINNKNFVLETDSKGSPSGVIFSNYVSFVPDEKKITVVSSGEGSDNILVIDIPKDLLNGNFTVLENGKTRDFHTVKIDGGTQIIMKVNFSDAVVANTRFDILGTQAIPEFPYLLLILVAGIIGVLTIGRKGQKLV